MRNLVLALLLFTSPLFSGPTWHLVWSDEFDGPAGSQPDAAKWTYDLGAGGWGNQELETYTNNARNVFLDGDGHLVIRALEPKPGEYTSARLKTKGKREFKYGRFEARMKIPKGQGLWPAFWMLGGGIESAGWPEGGEIDVMENIGKEPTVVHGTIHGPGYSGKDGISSQYSLPGNPPLANDFHVYAVEWSANSIRFLIDGHEYAAVTPASLPQGKRWVYDHPFFLLLNVAVGGGWPGNPDATTRFPQELIVDWVRVSQTGP
jgi:beta-glucanase (GH16 family)